MKDVCSFVADSVAISDDVVSNIIGNDAGIVPITFLATNDAKNEVPGVKNFQQMNSINVQYPSLRGRRCRRIQPSGDDRVSGLGVVCVRVRVRTASPWTTTPYHRIRPPRPQLSSFSAFAEFLRMRPKVRVAHSSM